MTGRHLVVAGMLAAVALIVEAAPERVTPLVVNPRGTSRRGSYAHVSATGETSVEMGEGGLPVVEWQGKRAVKIHVTHGGDGSFHVGIAMPSWTKFYLADYGPEGALEFDVAGSLSGQVAGVIGPVGCRYPGTTRAPEGSEETSAPAGRSQGSQEGRPGSCPPLRRQSRAPSR